MQCSCKPGSLGSLWHNMSSMQQYKHGKLNFKREVAAMITLQRCRPLALQQNAPYEMLTALQASIHFNAST